MDYTCKMIYEQLKNFIPIKNAIKTREEGEFLVLLSSDLKIHYFNTIAKEIYLSIDNSKTISHIYSEILSNYDVDETELKKDIMDFIRNMQWKNLIKLKFKDC